MAPDTSGNGGYNASSITILEGLSAVRKRPARSLSLIHL